MRTAEGHQYSQGTGAHNRTGQEERLGDLGLFREGKGRSYHSLQLLNGKTENKTRHFPEVYSDRTRYSKHKLEHRKLSAVKVIGI